MGDIYSENILDHYRSPRNYGTLEKHTHAAHDANPVCGDDIGMQLLVDSKGVIVDVRFSGEGCAISTAAASMLTEAVKGKKLADVKALDVEKLMKMMGIPLSPTRLKCALLPLYVLKQAAGENVRL